MIAQQNVFPRQTAILERNVNVVSQPDDRRRMNLNLGRMQYMSVVLFDARHALEDHHDGAAHRADIDRLERCVED